jgi:hypothetical protein
MLSKKESKSMNKELDLTIKEIEKMTKEEIATSPFDSGGAYGYSFEENKKVKNFDETPECKFYLKDGITFQINIYHWLKNMLDGGYLPKLTEDLQSKYGWWDSWDEWLDETFGEENYVSFKRENSYNYENFLSQPVLYRFFAVTEDGVKHADRALNGLDEEFVASNIEKSDKIYSDPMYIILSLHNGCDVRGGYTNPRVFRITTYDGVAGFYSTMESANIRCKKCDFYMIYSGKWMIEKLDGSLISLDEKMSDINTKLDLNEEVEIRKFDGNIYKKIKDCTIEEFIESTGRCPICGGKEFNAWFDYE